VKELRLVGGGVVVADGAERLGPFTAEQIAGLPRLVDAARLGAEAARTEVKLGSTAWTPIMMQILDALAPFEEIQP
jgi:hypothetical protein